MGALRIRLVSALLPFSLLASGSLLAQSSASGDPDDRLEATTQPVDPGAAPQGARSGSGRSEKTSVEYGSLNGMGGGSFILSGGGSPESRPDVYTVQRGDTLWSISSQFWGDPFFWPRLWSYNPSIGNAHQIFPSNLLRFTPGSYVRAPGMELGDAPVVANTSGEQVVVQEAVPTQVASRAASSGGRVPFLERSGSVKVRAMGFLKEQPILPLGKVVKAPDSKSLLAQGDLVYLQFNRQGDVQVGDIFMAYEPSKNKVLHPVYKRRNLGSLNRVLGLVEVMELTEFMATAKVLTSYAEMSRGALLTTPEKIDATVPIRPNPRELDGYIAAALNQENQTLGINDVLYIDRGEQDSVAVGDTFYVTRQGDGLDGVLKPGRRDIALPYQIVGRLVVVKPGAFVSQAVITEACGVIEVGDHIKSQVE